MLEHMLKHVSQALFISANYFCFLASIILAFSLLLVQKKHIKPAWYIIITVPVLALTFLSLSSDVVITSIIYYIVFQTLVFALFDKRRIIITFSIFYTLSALLFLYFSYEMHGENFHKNDFFLIGANLIIGMFSSFFMRSYNKTIFVLVLC